MNFQTVKSDFIICNLQLREMNDENIWVCTALRLLFWSLFLLYDKTSDITWKGNSLGHLQSSWFYQKAASFCVHVQSWQTVSGSYQTSVRSGSAESRAKRCESEQAERSVKVSYWGCG